MQFNYTCDSIRLSGYKEINIVLPFRSSTVHIQPRVKSSHVHTKEVQVAISELMEVITKKYKMNKLPYSFHNQEEFIKIEHKICIYFITIL